MSGKRTGAVRRSRGDGRRDHLQPGFQPMGPNLQRSHDDDGRRRYAREVSLSLPAGNDLAALARSLHDHTLADARGCAIEAEPHEGTAGVSAAGFATLSTRHRERFAATRSAPQKTERRREPQRAGPAGKRFAQGNAQPTAKNAE